MKYETFRSWDREFSPGHLKILKAVINVFSFLEFTCQNLSIFVYMGNNSDIYHCLFTNIESHVIHNSVTCVCGILVSYIRNYAETELLLCCSVTKTKVLDASGPPGFPSLLGGVSDTTITTAISSLSFSPDGEVCFNDTILLTNSYMGPKLQTVWFDQFTVWFTKIREYKNS